MRKIFFLLVVYMVQISTTSAQTNEENENYLNPVMSLNLCLVSISKIVDYNDRIILDQEYNNIINNLDLSSIKDSQIIKIIQELMDTLTHFRIMEQDKIWLDRIYRNKVDNAIYESFKSGPAIIVAGDPCTLAIIALQKVGTSYINYKNNLNNYRLELEQDYWELDKDAIIELNRLRKIFIKASWELIQKYNFPDEWRLTEEQISKYIQYLKLEDDERKLRLLKFLEDEFTVYPPYWFYLGMTAQNVGEKDFALYCYNNFERKRRGFLRNDDLYATMCMNRITLLKSNEEFYSDNESQIRHDIDIILKESKHDETLRTFAAICLAELGEIQEAEHVINTNIDLKSVDQNSHVSFYHRLLGDIYNSKDKTKFDTYLTNLIDQQNVSIYDKLYLVGKAQKQDLLEKLSINPSNIKLEISKNIYDEYKLWGGYSVISKLPDFWYYENIRAELKMDDTDSMFPSNINLNKDNHDMDLVFNNGLKFNYIKEYLEKDIEDNSISMTAILLIQKQNSLIEFTFETPQLNPLIQEFQKNNYSLYNIGISTLKTFTHGVSSTFAGTAYDKFLNNVYFSLNSVKIDDINLEIVSNEEQIIEE